MKKKYLAICFTGLFGLALSGVAQGASIHFNAIDSGTTAYVDSLTTYDTTYVDMAGIDVTVKFAGGLSQVVSWDTSGGAYGTDWSLTSNLPGTSTYSGGWWSFDTSNGVEVESIRLDGFANNVLFDIHPFDNSLYSSTDQNTLGLPDPESKGTVGSEWGQPLITDIWGAVSTYDGQVDVTYIGDVAITNTLVVGDLFQSMQIDFANGAFDSGDTFVFYQDTDNITNPVPEPATFALFGLGLAGLVGSRLRRKK